MKTVLIPGGSGALGTVVTLRLINDGYRCAVTYRSVEEAQKLRAHIAPQQRDQLLLLEADLMKDEEVERVVETAAEQSELYALVHILGGIRGFQSIEETTIEDWDFLLNLNLRSLFLFSRLVMKELHARGTGRIVTMGAMASVKPAASQAGYGVAKAGVSALTKILADEGRHFGVTANCILPSIIRTPANEEWGGEDDIPDWVTPDEIASTISYLLSSEADGVNGSDLRLFGKLNI
ncbi:SDR family oxidoreductase [bacterium]|nr:SDR family oxidoreductase [bacterium]